MKSVTKDTTVQSFSINDELVLLRMADRKIFVLNSTARFLWMGLKQGESLDTLVTEQTAVAGQKNHASIKRDFTNLRARWTAEHLLPTAASGPPSNSAQLETPLALSPPWQRPALYEMHIRLLHQTMRIATDDSEVFSVAVPLLDHLRVTSPKDTNWVDSLFVTRNEAGWVMNINHDSDLFSKSLGPLLHSQTLLRAYQRLQPTHSFHSAAVSVGDQSILLPGLSGSGKSTLSASLMCAGYGYCTDELAVLSTSPVQLVPCPVNLGLKKEAWSVLPQLADTLKKLPAWRRDDGRLVKYLQPFPETVQLSGQSKSIVALVFPKYQPKACPFDGLQPVSPATALYLLAESGYHLRAPIDATWLNGIVDWLAKTPSYQLEYANTKDAMEAITSLLPLP